MHSQSQGGLNTSGPLLGSIVTIIVVTVVMTTTLTTYSAAPLATKAASSSATSSASPPAELQWSSATPFPTTIWSQSCVASAGYFYCVGGTTGADTSTITDSVYFGPISPSGATDWANTTAYPSDIRSGSCVAWSATMYCVGGYNATAMTSDVYYAALSSSGVGEWKATTSYPTPVWAQSCVASAHGVYCVGGNTPSVTGTSTVFFAPFSGTGLGAWKTTSSYPVGNRQFSCVATATDIYCVGGLDNTGVYYAPLTSTGTGAWTNTTVYPFTVGANLLSCVTVTGYIYCVAGHTGPNVSSDVYYAALSSSGVGPWQSTGSYPVAVWGLSCATSQGEIYCAGGETASNAITDQVGFAVVSSS